MMTISSLFALSAVVAGALLLLASLGVAVKAWSVARQVAGKRRRALRPPTLPARRVEPHAERSSRA